MSIYIRPELYSKINAKSPTFIHKKTNSLNFSTNTGRFPENSNKYYKNKLELKTNQNSNTENNIVNSNNYMNVNSNINKLLTTTNKNSRKIEINLNKNCSPMSRLNKSGCDNIILLKHKQCTSQTNINHRKNNLKGNDDKECNIIINNNINNEKEKNNSKNKNLNNINININISKKIISTYYNKSKDKNNFIIKKKSINSIKNSESKEFENSNSKYYKGNNREDSKKQYSENIVKNQSTNILKKYTNKNSSTNNINGKESKTSLNLNSLGHFSTNSNMSTNTNKNTNNYTKINNNKNIHINYTSNDIYSNYLKDKENNNKKSQGNAINKIIKENKSMCLSQIQIPNNSSNSPRNINSIQNYLKYLHIGQGKNSPQNRGKNQKLSATNINFVHNHTENNASETYNNTFNYEYNSAFTQNNYKYNKKNFKEIPKGERRNTKDNIENKSVLSSKRNKKKSDESFTNENKVINEILIECPEELHFFYVKIFQKGKIINFDNKK